MNYVNVPHYEELSVNKLWPTLKDDAEFNIYFQDKYPDDKGPNHDYFFNILNTVYPDYLQQVTEHASKQRFTASGEEMKEQTIKVTDHWYDELSKMPFISCKLIIYLIFIVLFLIEKNGKTINLLKAKAKPISPKKKRNYIPSLGTIKDFKEA